MHDPSTWQGPLDRRLAALGVEPTRRAAIIAEVEQHLADAQRETLDPAEADRFVRALAGIERSSPLEPPVFGKARQSVMATLWQDVKYAARSLRLNPAYTAIVLGTLTLGIGANAAIFSVADAVMLRPYPYPDMDRIIVLSETTRAGQQLSIAWPTFQDWKAGSQSFEHLGIYRNAVVNLTGSGEPERLNGVFASSDVFGAMGVPAAAGRVFGAADDQAGAARVAIISERLWRGRFNADPGTLGRSVLLNGDPHVIVGIMPPAMRFPSRLTDVWLPLGSLVATLPPSRGTHPGLYGVGKLKAGVPFERAVADMDTIARRIEAAHPESNKDLTVWMLPYYEQIVRGIRPTLLVLLGAVGFVLLIGCANLANLMLARSERRQREIAVRSALGAERRRIIQQLLTESLLLAVAGGALGIMLATWIVKLFVASRPVTIPRIDMVAVDTRVVLFAAALSIATGVIFGLVPAVRASTPDILTSLKQTARGAGGGSSRRFRSVLVVAEVALALVLLVGAGLMIRSFARLMAIDPGFNAEGVVTMRVTLPASKYSERGRWVAFHDALVERVSGLAGVTDAAVNSALPLEGGGSEAGVAVEGRPRPTPANPGPTTLFQASSPKYHTAMGIPLIRGRYFTDHDTQTGTAVAIVDDRLVQRLFPGEDPLGKRISFEFHGTEMRWREIVGVVGHVRHYGIASEPPFVQLYVPLRQMPIYFENRRPSMALVVRTAAAPEILTGSIRRELAAIDPDIPVYGVQTMKRFVTQNTEQPRLNMLLLGGLGGLALLLAVIGIYGVISYSVAQRTQEIGVRIALGATRRDVMRLVVGHAALLILTGVAIGVGAALALGSFMRSLLFQVSERDPSTLAAIAALLAVVGLIAAVVPARRATRVDPLVALRSE